MKVKLFSCFVLMFAVVLFSSDTANAQVVKAVKKAAEKTKDVTVDATKKTVKVTKKIAGGTKDVTVKGAKKTGDVAGDVYEKSEDGVSKSADVVKEGFEDDGVADDVVKATANGTKKTVWFVGDKAKDFGKLGYKASKFVVVSTWDGTKWVSKKTYIWVKGEKEEVL